MFLHSKVKRPSAMFLSNFEISEKKYNELTSPISGHQGQLKLQDLLRKYDTDLSWKCVLDNLQMSVYFV